MDNFAGHVRGRLQEHLQSPDKSKLPDSVFSNYGLLEAMGTIQFTYSAGDQITPAAVVRQNYDRSIWEQLLPQMFSWKLVIRHATDNGQADTLPNFTFFIPRTRKCDILDSPPTNDRRQYWNYYLQKNHPFTSVASPGDCRTPRPRSWLFRAVRLDIPFQGYDFTPSINTYDNNDWFGPGPVSVPQPLTADRAVSIPSRRIRTCRRPLPPRLLWLNGIYHDCYTSADLDGVTIHQWALETPDGKGGYLETVPGRRQ